jgi:hypothetical protein
VFVFRRALVVVLLASDAAAAPSSLSVVVLPSRGPDAGALRDRAHAVAGSVAARLGLPLSSTRGGRALEITIRLRRARQLALAGSIDEAAALMDPTLEEAARAIDELDTSAGSELVTAIVRRVVIGLARGEVALARRLLARVLRYDPTFELLPGEGSPQVRAALDDLRNQAGGDSALEPADLGDVCARTSVILAARASSARPAIELSRFDECRLVAHALVRAVDEASAVAALSQVIPERRSDAGNDARARGRKIAGAIMGGAGLALAATGAYFAAHAAALKGSLDNCTAASPCPGQVLLSQGGDFDRSRIAASALLPVGAALVVAGALVYALASRHHRSGGAVATLQPTWTF